MERSDKTALDKIVSWSPETSGKVDELLKKIGNGFNWVALVSLLAMLSVITADILSSKLLNRPFTATVDLASLLATIVTAFAASQTILAGRHIAVDVIVLRLPTGIRRAFNVFASFLSFLFFLLLVWRCLVYAYDLQSLGETSLTQHIPIAPFAYGIAAACMPAVIIYAVQVCRDFKKDR